MNTDRNRCAEVRERLPLFVGGDLDAEILESVQDHLGSCGECARLAREAGEARGELVSAFRAVEGELPRPELWPAIRSRLHEEGLIRETRESAPALPPPAVRPTPVRRAPNRFTRVLAPIAAAAALLLVAQVGGFFSGADEDFSPSAPPPWVSDVTPEAKPDVAVTPVSTSGGLERVAPTEAERRMTLFRRAHRPVASGDASPASYLPPESR